MNAVMETHEATALPAAAYAKPVADRIIAHLALHPFRRFAAVKARHGRASRDATSLRIDLAPATKPLGTVRRLIA
jgi:hypothetical protein